MPGKKELVTEEIIEGKIFLIRGQKVMLDRDLAMLYDAPVKILNQAVKRNIRRFPADFMFQLNNKETRELVTNCDRFKSLKHSSSNPYAFTEQGVAMLSGVLHSARAVQVNIAIMRTFVKLRRLLEEHSDLSRKLTEIERKYDEQFKIVFKVLHELMEPPPPKRKAIGFHAEGKIRAMGKKEMLWS